MIKLRVDKASPKECNKTEVTSETAIKKDLRDGPIKVGRKNQDNNNLSGRTMMN